MDVPGPLIIVFLAGTLFQCVECGSKPHVLFILADDLGWNDVSWHNPDVKMPTLDKLAHKGVILNASYTQPTCSPSRGALMTGYYPFHLGMQHGILRRYMPKYMPNDKQTLAEALKDLGYSTHMIGKWHLGFCNWNYTPTYRGFDSFYGFYSGAEDYYTHKTYGGYDFRFNKSVHYPRKGAYSTTLFGKRAADIVLNHESDTEPLFMMLSFQGVHTPLQVPKKYSRQYMNIGNRNRRIYSGMITAMDDAVEEVLTALRKKKYMDNLLIVFTSDNGGASYIAGSNWPLRGAKATLWEGGTRVPSFVYSKTLFKKSGYVHDGMVHVSDWFPTIVRMAGGSTNPFIDGKDQWLTFSRGWMSPRTEFVYNIDDVTKRAAIRWGDYKLIVGQPGKYNNWYKVKTKPPCNAREGKVGYMYEDRQLLLQEKEEKREAKKGWWFASPLRYLNTVTSMLKSSPASGAFQKMSKWYDQYRCDRFMAANKREEASLKPGKWQLFNIREDPLEKNNLAGKKKVLLKKMMMKLRMYKRTLVPAQDKRVDKAANPKYFDGVWSPGWC